MTGRERILTALSVQEPDQVPLISPKFFKEFVNPQAGMTMKKVKDYCGDRLCLLGNIDCQQLIPAGTVAEVEAAVQQVIEDAAAGGGLIIDSSNTYHPGVKPENVMAVFTAPRKYGAYPPRHARPPVRP